jgi:hypothetical protein
VALDVIRVKRIAPPPPGYRSELLVMEEPIPTCDVCGGKLDVWGWPDESKDVAETHCNLIACPRKVYTARIEWVA